MDTTISIQPITNSQFLSVCNYITSFGIFLNSLGFVKIDERNQTVPVLNALFEYLNKFENQSKTKIQILQALFSETHHDHIGENKTLIDMKIAEEHYSYVINTALFSHYGYITGYLAEIINKKDNITSSILKQKVFQHLHENYTNNDQCSLIRRSSKLTLLAIERIFMDYILPIFTETWNTRENLNDGQKGHFQQLKRFKRNPSEDSDDDVLITDQSNEEKTNNYDSQTVKSREDSGIFKDADYYYKRPNEIEDVQKISESFETSGPIKRILKKDNWNIPSKVRKVEISDKVQHLDDDSIKKKLLTSQEQRKETKELEYNNFLMSLVSVKQNGLSFLKKDEEMYKKFISQINDLAAHQKNKEWMKDPIELWLRKSIKKLKQFEYLANLEGKAFNFDDITLLTKRKSGHLPYQLFRPFLTVFEMHVLYHVTSDTQYGFVDLGRFHDNFRDLFITFPNVIFTVTNTTVFENQNMRTAILQLIRNPLTQQDWYNNENNEPESVNEAGRSEAVSDSRQVEDDNIPSTSKKALAIIEGNKAENERMQAIQEAAKLISSDCKPVPGDYIKSVRTLKSYLLKLEQSDLDTSDVPSYGKLAEDYCDNELNVPEFYTRWWIKNGKYVDDVLFGNKFYFPLDANALYKDMKDSKTIKHTNDLWDIYINYTRNLSALQKTIRFEDFYQIRRAITRERFIPAKLSPFVKNATLTALYRLCLKQCNEKWDPVTLYQARLYSADYIKRQYTVHALQRFSLFPNLEVRDLSNKPHNNSLKIVLLKIEFKDPVYDIVDMGRVTPIEKGSHTFLFTKKFYVNGTEIYKIETQKILVINLSPIIEDTPKEDTMVKIVKELNKILSSETKVYLDEN